MTMMNEMDYNSAISVEDDEYVLLQPGTYQFQVDRVEFGRYEPNPQKPSKLPACPKVTVYLHVDTDSGRAFMQNNFFLHSSTQGLIAAYFKSLGMIPEGAKSFTMDWNGSIGKKGWVRTSIRVYNGIEYNQGDRFVKAPQNAAEQPAPAPVNSRFSGML